MDVNSMDEKSARTMRHLHATITCPRQINALVDDYRDVARADRLDE